MAKTIGAQIRDARIAAGFATQTKLAEKLGVSQKQVSVWENAQNIELATLRRIAEALGTTPDALVADSVEPGGGYFALATPDEQSELRQATGRGGEIEELTKDLPSSEWDRLKALIRAFVGKKSSGTGDQ